MIDKGNIIYPQLFLVGILKVLLEFEYFTAMIIQF